MFRHAERALSVSGTVFMMWRNGAFRVMRKAFSLDGRAFFTVWNRLFRMEVRARLGGRRASVDVLFCVMC